MQTKYKGHGTKTNVYVLRKLVSDIETKVLKQSLCKEFFPRNPLFVAGKHLSSSRNSSLTGVYWLHPRLMASKMLASSIVHTDSTQM